MTHNHYSYSWHESRLIYLDAKGREETLNAAEAQVGKTAAIATPEDLDKQTAAIHQNAHSRISTAFGTAQKKLRTFRGWALNKLTPNAVVDYSDEAVVRKQITNMARERVANAESVLQDSQNYAEHALVAGAKRSARKARILQARIDIAEELHLTYSRQVENLRANAQDYRNAAKLIQQTDLSRLAVAAKKAANQAVAELKELKQNDVEAQRSMEHVKTADENLRQWVLNTAPEHMRDLDQLILEAVADGRRNSELEALIRHIADTKDTASIMLHQVRTIIGTHKFFNRSDRAIARRAYYEMLIDRQSAMHKNTVDSLSVDQRIAALQNAPEKVQQVHVTIDGKPMRMTLSSRSNAVSTFIGANKTVYNITHQPDNGVYYITYRTGDRSNRVLVDKPLSVAPIPQDANGQTMYLNAGTAQSTPAPAPQSSPAPVSYPLPTPAPPPVSYPLPAPTSPPQSSPPPPPTSIPQPLPVPVPVPQPVSTNEQSTTPVAPQAAPFVPPTTIEGVPILGADDVVPFDPTQQYPEATLVPPSQDNFSSHQQAV